MMFLFSYNNGLNNNNKAAFIIIISTLFFFFASTAAAAAAAASSSSSSSSSSDLSVASTASATITTTTTTDEMEEEEVRNIKKNKSLLRHNRGLSLTNTVIQIKEEMVDDNNGNNNVMEIDILQNTPPDYDHTPYYPGQQLISGCYCMSEYGDCLNESQCGGP